LEVEVEVEVKKKEKKKKRKKKAYGLRGAEVNVSELTDKCLWSE